jgi:type I restriction-modification system DNA methylase subunit
VEINEIHERLAFGVKATRLFCGEMQKSMASKASTSLARQLAFPDMCPVSNAVQMLASAGIEARGAIFTRREVVDFILDLTGYTVDRPLHTLRLLEPSFGDGDFLLPVIDRLLAAAERAGVRQLYPALGGAICGVELHETTYAKTCEKVVARLEAAGLSRAQAKRLASQWLRCGDFLLQDFAEGFDFAVGNPPYVRQELIPDALMTEYRARYSTIFDRADLYVPFIEHSLDLLQSAGHLGFICADRWMKNRYGGPLRNWSRPRSI